ncbi:hypothetical protein TWF730_000991 [Orbilia blumenaviensis]|uniref:Uncharacterized protein n=1 Tax=Orbilia blumenaviensis TaxID=1796055 RepID=A0AAV9VQY7_9PEZI
MLQEPTIMAKKPIPAAPLLKPIFPKFATVAGSCCFINIRIVNSKHVRDKCNCRSFIQQARLEDSWSSLDRYFCSCGHHAQYHPPRSQCANIIHGGGHHDASMVECDMEAQEQEAAAAKEDVEQIPLQIPRSLTPVPPQEAENNRHIWHLYQKTAKLEQEISQKPNPEDVRSVGDVVGSLEERIMELEDRLEDTELRLEESERKATVLQGEMDDLINENEDLRRDSASSSVERFSDNERLSREESDRRLHEALTALKPVSKENPWRVHVNLVLDPDQKNPPPIDCHEHTRCETVGCYQYIKVEGSSPKSFQQALSSSFTSSLLTKQWVPLIASQTEDGQIELERPTDLENFPSLWSVNFLRHTCAVTVDGLEKLYIAPHSGPLNLEELDSPRESPGLTEASTISSTSNLRRSSRKRSITGNIKTEAPVIMKRPRVKSKSKKAQPISFSLHPSISSHYKQN